VSKPLFGHLIRLRTDGSLGRGEYARTTSGSGVRLSLDFANAKLLRIGAVVAFLLLVAAFVPGMVSESRGERLGTLVQNAQDASESGEVVIHTRLGESGHRVRLTVQDSGPGFAEKILKRAFEPYVTTKTKGTGLGLAVVKKIADEHGAWIELSNRIVDGAVAGAQVSLSFALASEPRGVLAYTEDSKPSSA